MVRPEVKKKRQELAVAARKSHKERKRLEKIVLHKRSKVDRRKLLENLKKCQLQPDQLERLHSTSSMQTAGLKRFMSDQKTVKVNQIERAEACLDAAILLKRKRRRKKNKGNSKIDESQSEDTDDMSTDTEIYYSSDSEKMIDDENRSHDENNPDSSVESNRLEAENQNPDQSNAQSKQIQSIPPVRRDNGYEKDKPSQPAVYVQVYREAAVQAARLELPIINEEQSIMEAIRYNDIVIVSGETGSGKTTQIPQFLYEAGYTLNDRLIGITEPRRVAAISMSERVAHELNLTSDEVSYQIRFSGNVTEHTRVKFMTDGVLLKECQHDFLLSKYSVIIIDEAHERSVFSDVLIGLLSRIVPLRAKRDDPLKLVIMSATLRVTDFTNNQYLFKIPPPVINIEARQYPVTMQFARKTPANYLQAAYRKVCSVHSRMPKGGILVFVTSQMDVKTLCAKLREKYPHEAAVAQKSNPKKRTRFKTRRDRDAKKATTPSNPGDRLTIENIKADPASASEDEDADDLNIVDPRDVDEWSNVDSDSDAEDGIISSTKTPLHCLGLYAMLPLEKQKLVFREPPDGSRLCVIATNVAETSITIPNIRYVVDTGLEKVKVYDTLTGVSKFVVTWTSKSSAEQRMGRAGRMGPGQCFRLYSSAVYTNDFPEYAEPKILQKPVEDLLLQMKVMNIDNVVNFPFPTRPSLDSLMVAEKKLIMLDALDDVKFRNARYDEIEKTEFSSRPTSIGKAMARFAVSARCAKMIVLCPTNLLATVIGLVSAMTVREIFIDEKNLREVKKKLAGHGQSKLLGDFMVMIKAISKYEEHRDVIRPKAMQEIERLRKHLTREVAKNLIVPAIPEKMLKPTDSDIILLRQLLLSSHLDRIARKRNVRQGKLKYSYECSETDKPVFIGPESVLKGSHPEYLIYSEIYESDTGKKYMRNICAIDAAWLSTYSHKVSWAMRLPNPFNSLKRV